MKLKKPELLILIVIWEFVTALISLIGILAVALFAFPRVVILHDIARLGGVFGLSIVIVLLAAYLCLSVTAGSGLIIGKAWGRLLAIIHAVLSLIKIPFGTIIGGLTLFYLFSREVEAYFEGEPSAPVTK